MTFKLAKSGITSDIEVLGHLHSLTRKNGVNLHPKSSCILPNAPDIFPRNVTHSICCCR